MPQKKRSTLNVCECARLSLSYAATVREDGILNVQHREERGDEDCLSELGITENNSRADQLR